MLVSLPISELIFDLTFCCFSYPQSFITCSLRSCQEKGIWLRYTKQDKDKNKDKLNFSENGKCYYSYNETLCCLELPFPINNRMTMAFSENGLIAVKNALEKRWRKY